MSRGALPLVLLGLLAWVPATLVVGAQEAPRTWAGSELREALAELQSRGLKLLFSDRLVRPDMRIAEEPTDGSLTHLLEQFLAPHQLQAATSSSGWLIVVRTAAAAAPLPPEPHRLQRISESIIVRPRLRVPVNVVLNGAPVRSLVADDFQLTLERRRQSIVDLEVVDLERNQDTNTSVATLPTAGRRHFLLAFDMGVEGAGSLNRARTIAHELVRDGLHPTDLVGVATLSANLRPNFAIGFSSDREAVLDAVDVVTGASSAILETDPLGLVARTRPRARGPRQLTREGKDLVRSKSRLRSVIGPSSGRRVDGLAREDGVPSTNRRLERDREMASFLGLAEAMTQLARTLRHTPGTKHIVLLSEGFDGALLVGVGAGSGSEQHRTSAIADAALTGELWNVNSEERFGDSSAQSRMNLVAGEFNRSHAVIHAVDTQVGAEAQSLTSPSRNGLSHLASSTGGTYIAGGQPARLVLKSLNASSSVTYLLSIERPHFNDSRPPRLDVKLRKGLAGRVLHSPVLTEALSLAELSADQRRLSLADRLTGGPDDGGFSSRLSFAGVRYGGAAATVSVSVSALFQDVAERPKSEVELYVYAFSLDGEVHDYFAQRATLEVQQPTAAGVRRFRLLADLELSPGSYLVRSLLLNPRTGASSLAQLEIEVDDDS